MARLVGGLEAGGTKFVCAVGTGPDDVRAEREFPRPRRRRRSPAWWSSSPSKPRASPLAASASPASGPSISIRARRTFGSITTTPKAGWRHVDLVGPLRRALDIPVAFDTDVNGAALAEHRWGSARGVRSLVYVTVGSGIGGGAVMQWPAGARARPSGDGPSATAARPRARSVPRRVSASRRLLGGSGLGAGARGTLGAGSGDRCPTRIRPGISRRTTWRSAWPTWSSCSRPSGSCSAVASWRAHASCRWCGAKLAGVLAGYVRVAGARERRSRATW